ncbi:type II toxin-antitoxin system HicA family toxin [Thermodesulfobacteriota bacterium]
MGRKEKLLEKLQKRSNDFTWNELTNLLKLLGYEQRKAGKIGGSRRRFVHSTAPTITLHKPHPSNSVKKYVINDILGLLRREGII